MFERFPKFDKEILDIRGEAFSRAENLVISEKCRIPLVLLSGFGAFVFVETVYKKSTDITMAMFALKKTLYLTGPNVSVFIRSPSGDYIFSNHFISCEEITKEKVLKAIEDAGEETVLSGSMIRNLEDHMRRFSDRKNRRILVKDGITYELHSVTSPLGFFIRDAYFPVADDDPRKFLMLAVIGGMFGLHKFAAGEYVPGIFYLFTCGGFGVFFLFDIIAILTGSYYIRQVSYEAFDDTYKRTVWRIYLKRPCLIDRLFGSAGFVFAVIASYLVYVKLFIPALTGIGLALIGA